MDSTEKQYIDFKVYATTKLKDKYGYRIILKYDDGSIKTIQKGGFKSKKEANTSRDTTLVELHSGTFIIDDSIYIDDFLKSWLDDVMKPKITSDSYDSYKNVVHNHLIPEFKHLKITLLNTGHIQKLYNKKAETSVSITKLCRVVIKTALNYALEKKYVQTNVALNAKIPKNIKKGEYRKRTIDTTKTLNEEQIMLLIEKSKDTPIHLQILFAVLMGLRRGEINGLKYSDVDFIHRTLTVQRQLGKKANTDTSTLKKGEYTKQDIPVKTFSSNRTLNIPDIVFEAILEEKKKYEKNKSRRINDTRDPFRDYNYIVCSTYGNPRSKSFHIAYYKKLLKDCNLPDIRFHDLRATYCTLLLKNNFSAKAVSKLMGHATEIISMDVYGDNKQIITDCLEELEPFIKSVLPDMEEEQIVDGSDFEFDSDKLSEWLPK